MAQAWERHLAEKIVGSVKAYFKVQLSFLTGLQQAI